MKFNMSRTGGRTFLNSPLLRSILTEQAEIVQAIYRENVKQTTGRNAREVRISTRVGGMKNDRWIAAVLAYSPYAAYREWGTKRNPADKGLRDALQQLGTL